MTKYLLFAKIDETLVYRKTGKAYEKGYTIKGNTVYGENGRKIGNISKNLTKKEKARIEKAELNRQKKAERSFKKVENARDENDYAEKDDVSLNNFMMVLTQAWIDGAINETEFNDFRIRYLDADKRTRSLIWKELYALFRERDYDPSD